MLYILRITLVRIKLSTSTVKHSLEISRENQFHLFILFSFLGLLLSYCYKIYYLKPNKRKNLITCIGKNDTNTVYRKPTSHRMIHVCFKEKKKYILVWTSVLPLHLPLPACSSVRSLMLKGEIYCYTYTNAALRVSFCNWWRLTAKALRGVPSWPGVYSWGLRDHYWIPREPELPEAVEEQEKTTFIILCWIKVHISRGDKM